MSPETPRRGMLFVVGTGIKVGAQLTCEVTDRIRSADRVFHLVNDAFAREAIGRLNENHASLHHLFAHAATRREAYEAMVEAILEPVRGGERVCAAFYGHPIVFVYPSRLAAGRARAEGYRVEILPGISAMDCLFADLLLDPAERGCVMHEASDFLEEGRWADPSLLLVLWQVGLLGEERHSAPAPSGRHMDRLAARLLEIYPSDHESYLYEASRVALYPSMITPVKLCDLAATRPSAFTTLVVPARSAGCQPGGGRESGRG